MTMSSNTFIYILLMVLVTNGIRVLPVLLIRGKIRNRFVRSFLYYVPYVTLSVMTVPAITQVTESPLPGLFALVAGLLVAWRGWSLFCVSILCCVIVWIANHAVI